MNLVGYTATALSRNDIEDTPTNKNVVDFAVVELKDLSGNLVTIYDDALGANPETQKTCDTNGQVTFFAEVGDYDLEINGKAQRINLSSGLADFISTKTDESVQDFIDTFALKIFQSPADDLTEIKTRTLLGGEVYEVRKVSDNSFADIYTDKEGLNPIPQDGTSNVSGSDGAIEFYIADEMYYINSGSASSNFNVGNLDSSITIRKLGYKFGEDAKPYILKAATLGYKKIILPKGAVKLSQFDLTSTVSGVEVTGAGSGFAYTPSTVIEPFSAGQTDLFISQSGVGGVDNVKFSKFKIAGGFNTDYGIRQLSGAGWEYEDLQGDGCKEWILWSEQGLNSYNRIYLKPDRALSTGGLMAYSDYFMSKVEVSGGGTGFWLSAGGGRFTDCLANAQSEQCVLIKPLTSTTNHINTSVLGLYTGEVFNALESPIINVENNGASRVRDVQFSNLHTVSAQGTGGEKHNIHCKITNADRVTFNAWQALGIGSFENATRYDAGGLHLSGCNDIKLASGMIYDISKAAIKVENSSLQIGGAFAVKNWGGAFATGKDSAAIQCSDSTSRVSIGNMEFINERVSALKAIDADNGIFFSISTPVVRLFGTLPQNVFEFTSNEPAYSVKQANDNTLYMFGSRCTYKGQFSSTSGGGSFSIVTLPNISQNASYEINIQQVSNGANATTGNIFTFESTCGVCTTGNTNSTTSLQNNFTNTGLDVGVDIGTGYGVTTWQYSITRSV